MNFSQHWSDGRATTGRSRKTWVFWLVLLCLVVGAATWVQWQNILGNPDLFEEETATEEMSLMDLFGDDDDAPPPLASITLPDILPETIELEGTEEEADLGVVDTPLSPDKTGIQWVTYQKAAEGKALLAIVIKAPVARTPPACSAEAAKALEAALELHVPLTFNVTPAPCALQDWLPPIQTSNEHQILLSLGSEANPEHLETLSELLPDAVGVTGSFPTGKDGPNLKPLFNQIRRAGLFYLGHDNARTGIAQATGTPHLTLDMAVSDAGALEHAEKTLLTRNAVGQMTILEIPMTPAAISTLQKILPHLAAQGIAVVPLSLLLNPALLKQHFDASGAI